MAPSARARGAFSREIPSKGKSLAEGSPFKGNPLQGESLAEGNPFKGKSRAEGSPPRLGGAQGAHRRPRVRSPSDWAAGRRGAIPRLARQLATVTITITVTVTIISVIAIIMIMIIIIIIIIIVWLADRRPGTEPFCSSSPGP